MDGNKYETPYSYKRVNITESNDDPDVVLVGPNADQCEEINADPDYLLNFGFAQGKLVEAEANKAEIEKMKTIIDHHESKAATDFKELERLRAKLKMAETGLEVTGDVERILRAQVAAMGKMVEAVKRYRPLNPHGHDAKGLLAWKEVLSALATLESTNSKETKPWE